MTCNSGLSAAKFLHPDVKGRLMPDRFSPEVRSRIMARVRSKGTKPELVVRRALHRLGYRYRLHRADLPGCPDLTFHLRRKVLFVNGCFWHLHPGCSWARIPVGNRGYWLPKLNGNRKRDLDNLAALKRDGWEVFIVWECELKDWEATLNRVIQFLGPVKWR